MEEEEVAVILYTQTPTNAKAGTWEKGGLGKLASLVYKIVEAESKDEIDESAPKPKPIVASKSDMDSAERSAQVLIKQINELGEESSNSPTLVEESSQGEVFKG